MTRTYTLKRRAESQAATRQRIVEAAVELHSSIGPAQTTISMVAERAGVQRHTFYAHFPDERSLYLACSGLAMERDPLPDARSLARDRGSGASVCASASLRSIGGMSAMRSLPRASCVTPNIIRSPEKLSRCASDRHMTAYRDVLGAKLTARQCPLLRLALSFFTWRTLTRESGLKQGTAVDAMVQAIDCAR